MAQYKCKRCGNLIEVENGAIIAVCDNCLLAQPIVAENISVESATKPTSTNAYVDDEIQPLIRRGFLFLEDGKGEKADEYFERILDKKPECAEAYLGKLMAEIRVRKRDDLINYEQSIKGDNYDKIMRFGDDKIKAEIKAVADAIENRISPGIRPAEGESSEQEENKTTEYETAVAVNKTTGFEGEIKTKKPSKKMLLILIAVLLVVAVAVSGIFIWRDSAVPASFDNNPEYNKALALMGSGEYVEAISAFALLDGYKDSEEKINECKEKINEGIYNMAVEAEKDSDKATAAILFGQAGDYKDAEERSFALWDEIAVRETVSAGSYHTSGLKKDGTVVATAFINDEDFFYDGQCDVEDWKDIVAISADGLQTIGLKKDGTVVAVGWNNDYQCDVGGWEDIVAISAGGSHTVGLKKDGTVVETGWDDDEQYDADGWKDIVAISAGQWHSVGLKKDGTVVATKFTNFNEDHYQRQCDVEGWEDIVTISTGYYHTVGLKKDGTVVATGLNDYGRCDVEDWKDIKIPE